MTSSARQSFISVTHSACSECGSMVPAKVLAREEGVYLRKFCPRHGESEALIWTDVASYLSAQRYVKPAWTPKSFSGDASKPCGEGCGFCDRHEQHLCLPIVEITGRCDLQCPICLVDAGSGHDMSVLDFDAILDRLIDAEEQIQVLNLSGGEPLLHPDILSILDSALSRREIVRVSISTNGLRLLDDAKLLSDIKARDAVVSLQFDGFDDRIYQAMRGRPLLEEKLRILDLLSEADIPTSLTFTAAAGINDDQFGPMLDLLFSRGNIISMMVQPLAFTGRASGMQCSTSRMTIPDVIRALGSAGNPAVAACDFVPLPCSHPVCFSLAFYLMLDDGRALSLNRLIHADELLDSIANQVFFGLDAAEHSRLKDMIYTIWSGPAAAAPDGRLVMSTLRGLLDKISAVERGLDFDPRALFAAGERNLKSIFVHAFQDADTFDLARARRCCNGYPQSDGRIIPACVRNVVDWSLR